MDVVERGDLELWQVEPLAEHVHADYDPRLVRSERPQRFLAFAQGHFAVDEQRTVLRREGLVDGVNVLRPSLRQRHGRQFQRCAQATVV